MILNLAIFNKRKPTPRRLDKFSKNILIYLLFYLIFHYIGISIKMTRNLEKSCIRKIKDFLKIWIQLVFFKRKVQK